MITAIFETIGTAITQFAAVLGNGFTSAVALVWSGTALTPLGTLLLIGAAGGLVWFAVKMILKLVRGAGR